LRTLIDPLKTSICEQIAGGMDVPIALVHFRLIKLVIEQQNRLPVVIQLLLGEFASQRHLPCFSKSQGTLCCGSPRLQIEDFV
tara:strand:- start:432 stop:680 length:249 start_codon:yes stop_codon:yes gene_type:complete